MIQLKIHVIILVRTVLFKYGVQVEAQYHLGNLTKVFIWGQGLSYIIRHLESQTVLDLFQRSTLPMGPTVKNSSLLIHSVQETDWKIHQWWTQKNETFRLREKGKRSELELSLRAARHNSHAQCFSFARVAGVVVGDSIKSQVFNRCSEEYTFSIYKEQGMLNASKKVKQAELFSAGFWWSFFVYFYFSILIDFISYILLPCSMNCWLVLFLFRFIKRHVVKLFG